jgi:PKD repeat protein
MSPLRTFFATFAAFSMSAKKPSPRLRIGRFQYLTVLFLTFFCLPSMAEAQTERSCQVNPEQVSPLLQMHQPQGRIFEDQVAQFIENQRLKKAQLGKTAEQTDETIRIPIIVHIIHAGEKIGEGANISREQVYSQIEVLNEDFNRRNADARNTPAQFLPVAAALNVEFVPATLDPEGLPLAEAGIHRYNACRTLWTPSNFEAEVKPKTIWNPDQYLNIWTVAFQRGIYGFGQFPNSSHLEGLSENEGQARTDGVMINYRNFGSILKVRTPQLLDGEPNNLGRTATHEIGHFLGLIHIWGDTNCGNDYCQDTPTHQNSNSGCPSHPKPNNCGTNDEMFENFMDYSHDVCMNIFTKNQVERMEAVLSISPRRKTLKDSDRAADLSERVFALFKSEKSKACQGQAIRFQEDVRLFDAADAVISYHWTFQNGSPATSTAPNPLVSYANAGTFSVTLSVQTRLGKTHTHNSTITIESPATAQVNPEQGFENRRLENGWQAEGWNFASLGSSSNVSMVADNFTTLYCGENHPILESPQVLLPANRLLKIDFDLAYTARSSDFTDSLEIAFSTDCGGTYQVIWKRGGSSLMTAPAQNGVFSPRPQDWRTQSAYLYVEDLSISSVQIRFRNIGRRVNNLYLDNIRIANMEDLRPPLADFEADYTTLLTNESLNLTNLSENSFEYLWQITGSRSILSEEENPSVLLSEAGNYDVSLTAKNPLGTNQVTRPN